MFSQDPYNQELGYKALTTFWLDFSLAEGFGQSSVKETYDNAIQSWKDNCKFMTEMALVLNHKGWVYQFVNPRLASFYFDLWEKHNDFVFEHFKEDEEAINYFLEVTD